MKKERLLILGASVRAAAQSAVAAGYEVIAADQFADRDLREICPDARPVKYPEGLLEFAMTVEPCAWMYTGAMENYPEIVEKISERHELLGNGAEVLRRVRNRDELFGFLEQWSSILLPEICYTNPSPTKKWIIKKSASAGGLGIREANADSELRKGEFFQEFLDGTSASVSFLANGKGAEPMFGSMQFQGVPCLGAPVFHYEGGMTSLRWELFPRGSRKFFKELGNSLAREFQLRGVFGADFIVIDNKYVTLLEVNPRFTASMGLFERFFDASLVNLHVDACRNTEPMDVPFPRGGSNYRASGILYAKGDCHITDRMSDRLWSMRGELDLADLPMGGSAIGKGHPVLTIFAEGDSREETMRSLESKANQLRALGIP